MLGLWTTSSRELRLIATAVAATVDSRSVV
jgi:hypothetical protein